MKRIPRYARDDTRLSVPTACKRVQPARGDALEIIMGRSSPCAVQPARGDALEIITDRFSPCAVQLARGDALRPSAILRSG
jgi:hypothetical protein